MNLEIDNRKADTWGIYKYAKVKLHILKLIKGPEKIQVKQPMRLDMNANENKLKFIACKYN